MAELKFINCSRSYYHHGAGGVRAVQRRAEKLPNEYRKKARNTDRHYCGVVDPVDGPPVIGAVEKRLNQYGELIKIVIGAFSEGSDDLHELVNTIAVARLNSTGLARGREGSEGELSQLVSQVRRHISVSAVRANAECLLARLYQAGPGAKLASKNRDWALREQEIMRKEREAQFQTKTRGGRILRRGQFLME